MMNLNPSTSSGRTAPFDHGSDHCAGPSQQTNDQSRTTPTPQAREYQWSDELVDALSALPPRSNLFAKFSIIADPAVSNPMRAYMFANHLRAKAIPISEGSQPVSFNSASGNPYSLAFSCTCQEACRGHFVVSVDDDTSHPYGVPGQRITAVLWHQNLPG